MCDKACKVKSPKTSLGKKLLIGFMLVPWTPIIGACLYLCDKIAHCFGGCLGG